MVEVIDQTWVEAWVGEPASREEADLCRTWLQSINPHWFPLVLRVPPLAIVKAIRPMEVPYPFTVGYVAGYASDNTLLVHQSPDSMPAEVAEKDLTVVGYWKGLNSSIVQRLLPQRKPRHGLLRF